MSSAAFARDATARIAELEAAALRDGERHAESMRSVRLRAEHAEARVIDLEHVVASLTAALDFERSRRKAAEPHGLRRACALVEDTLRRVHHGEIQVIIARDDHVEVAPFEWREAVEGRSLFEALEMALKGEPRPEVET